MSTTSSNQQLHTSDSKRNIANSVVIEEAISNLMLSQRSMSKTVSSVLDNAAGIIHRATDELVTQKKESSFAKKSLEDLESQLLDLQNKYEILYSGLLNVLTQKFPGESLISIEHRMDALLLASNSGFEIGRQNNLSSPESSSFVDIIDGSLTQE